MTNPASRGTAHTEPARKAPEPNQPAPGVPDLRVEGLPPDAVAPPADGDAPDATLPTLRAFAADLRQFYGPRLAGLYRFGRGRDGRAVSPDRVADVDVAVVLSGAEFSFWDEKWAVTDLACGLMLGSGFHIHAWPFSREDWETPAGRPIEHLVRMVRRSARAFEEAA